MKKAYKYFVIAFIFIFLFFVSCQKKTVNIDFENDINVYNSSSVEVNKVKFESVNFKNTEYSDHILKMEFNLKITNYSPDNIIIKISDSKSYGNDDLLQEEVYKAYNHDDSTKNVKFTENELTLISNDNVLFNYILVINDGNPKCKYRLDFKINDKKLSIYSYQEGYEPDSFYYVHNPIYNSGVMLDSEYDSNCVFGFKPNNTGSLKSYTQYDWTIKEDVLKYKADRIKYIEENDKRIKELEASLRAKGKSIEEIAKACSNLRNQIRLEQYANDPEGLEVLKQRNLEKYGHEEGPLPEELYVKYNNSWEMVLEKSYSTNRGMDACCGVYDLYYYMYNSK